MKQQTICLRNTHYEVRWEGNVLDNICCGLEQQVVILNSKSHWKEKIALIKINKKLKRIEIQCHRDFIKTMTNKKRTWAITWFSYCLLHWKSIENFYWAQLHSTLSSWIHNQNLNRNLSKQGQTRKEHKQLHGSLLPTPWDEH